MANKRNATNKEPDQSAPADLRSTQVDSEDHSLSLEMDQEDSFLGIEFEDLFGDGSESVIVELIRNDPKFFAGQRVGGFLCHLPPGSTKEWIRENYGGGQFRVLKKGSNGKIIESRAVAIAGSPFLPASPGAARMEPAAALSNNQAADLAPVLTKEGIPVGIADENFIRMVQQLALVRSAFPDPNTELIKALMERQSAPQQDLVGLAGQIIGLVNQFRDIMPAAADESKGSGGAGLMDVLREGIAAFGLYMKAQQGRPAPQVMPLGSRPELRPADPPSLANPDPPALPAPESEAPKMSVQEFINSAIVVLCNGYVMKKSAADLVAALDATIPIPRPFRVDYLAKQKDAFKNLCDVNLSDDFFDDPALADAFPAFFDEVWNGFLGIEKKS